MHMLVANWLSGAYSDAKFNAFESLPKGSRIIMRDAPEVIKKSRDPLIMSFYASKFSEAQWLSWISKARLTPSKKVWL